MLIVRITLPVEFLTQLAGKLCFLKTTDGATVTLRSPLSWHLLFATSPGIQGGNRRMMGDQLADTARSETARNVELQSIYDRLEIAEEMIRQASYEVASPRKTLKLIIQIPCYNEEQTLGITLKQLPREIPGVDSVEWLVIDDGSRDNTVCVAREYGVDHIVQQPRNQGLARAFMKGVEASLARGADIIVNTDADNQYAADDIETLIRPILTGHAEFVVGERPIQDTPHFSPAKKLLQRLGSWVVRQFSKTNVPDAPSGFRAMSRETAMRLNVFSDYTYTLETIIQAGQKSMAITSVPVKTNADLRPSRLLKSIPNYVLQSALTIVRIFAAYRPFQFFAVPSLLAGSLGTAICLRFVYFYVTDGGAGHVQSLILGSLLVGLGFAGIVIGLVADLISVNRKLLEEIDWRIHQLRDEVQELHSTAFGVQEFGAPHDPKAN